MLKPAGKEIAKTIANKTVKFILENLMRLDKDIIVQELRLLDLREIIDKYGKNYNIFSFYLKCSLEKAIERNSKRQKRARSKEQIIESHKRIFHSKEDFIIDTEKNSAEECVNIILKKIEAKT